VIDEALWMTETEILRHQEQLRSHLVLEAIRDYRKGQRFPLDLLGQ
jgi:hypothetical protein